MSSFMPRTGRLPTTGHAGDDELLAHLSDVGRLDAPRHWVHYFLLAHSRDVNDATTEIRRGGWVVQHSGQAANGVWVVIAEQTHARLSVEAVRRARAFFEQVSATYPDSTYEGWEASL